MSNFDTDVFDLKLERLTEYHRGLIDGTLNYASFRAYEDEDMGHWREGCRFVWVTFNIEGFTAEEVAQYLKQKINHWIDCDGELSEMGTWIADQMRAMNYH